MFKQGRKMLGSLIGGGSDWYLIAISYVIVVVLSLSLHEFAHAFAAYKCGDNTPKVDGRLSLNPFNHIDPIGFICCVLFKFGWARPVNINPNNFRNVKKGLAWTSIAGVLMNILLGFIGCGAWKIVSKFAHLNGFLAFLEILFYCMFTINIALAVFNFLPIYPLDGFRFIATFTKYDNGFVNFMYRYGTFVLLGILLLFDDILGLIIAYLEIPIVLFWNLIL